MAQHGLIRLARCRPVCRPVQAAAQRLSLMQRMVAGGAARANASLAKIRREMQALSRWGWCTLCTAPADGQTSSLTAFVMLGLGSCQVPLTLLAP